MPSGYLQGIQSAFDNQAAIANDIHVVTSNWFVNRCPIVTRTPRVPVGSTTFSIVSRRFRPRIFEVRDRFSSKDSTISLADASPLMNGDVLELASGDRVEVIAHPNLATNSIAVRRGAEGTISSSGSPGEIARLISNSRTGAEVDQHGIAMRPACVHQYCQTWQHPLQVGGSLQASSNFRTSAGVRTPFEQGKMDALQNLMDDIETSTYYGRGEDPAVASRPKQKGLRVLIDQANVTTTPVNADDYRPEDLVRDVLEPARRGGGQPDVLVVSSEFMSGFAAWGKAAVRVDAGTNVFGNPIDVFEAPFLAGISLIEAPLLWPYTAFALTSSEVRMRMKRNEFWSPRGSRGDAFEGDWIAEGAVEIENPSHHAWLEGVKAFAS
jgi:hypothetical protein